MSRSRQAFLQFYLTIKPISHLTRSAGVIVFAQFAVFP